MSVLRRSCHWSSASHWGVRISQVCRAMTIPSTVSPTVANDMTVMSINAIAVFAPGAPSRSRAAPTVSAQAPMMKQISMIVNTRRMKNLAGGSEVIGEAPREGRKDASLLVTSRFTASEVPAAGSGTVRRSRTSGSPLGSPLNPDS